MSKSREDGGRSGGHDDRDRGEARPPAGARPAVADWQGEGRAEPGRSAHGRRVFEGGNRVAGSAGASTGGVGQDGVAEDVRTIAASRDSAAPKVPYRQVPADDSLAPHEGQLVNLDPAVPK
jgi:hypothetical protein